MLGRGKYVGQQRQARTDIGDGTRRALRVGEHGFLTRGLDLFARGAVEAGERRTGSHGTQTELRVTQQQRTLLRHPLVGRHALEHANHGNCRDRYCSQRNQQPRAAAARRAPHRDHDDHDEQRRQRTRQRGRQHQRRRKQAVYECAIDGRHRRSICLRMTLFEADCGFSRPRAIGSWLPILLPHWPTFRCPCAGRRRIPRASSPAELHPA